MKPEPRELTRARELIANTEKNPERLYDLQEGLSLIEYVLEEYKNTNHAKTALNIYRTYKKQFINNAKEVLSHESDPNKWKEYCDILNELEQTTIDDDNGLVELKKFKDELLVKWARSYIDNDEVTHHNVDSFIKYIVDRISSETPEK